MKAVTVDEQYAATVDFARLSVASGILNPPKVTVAYDEEEESFQFMQEVQPEEDGYAFFDDRVYGVLYETERNRSRLVVLKTVANPVSRPMLFLTSETLRKWRFTLLPCKRTAGQLRIACI